MSVVRKQEGERKSRYPGYPGAWLGRKCSLFSAYCCELTASYPSLPNDWSSSHCRTTWRSFMGAVSSLHAPRQPKISCMRVSYRNRHRSTVHTRNSGIRRILDTDAMPNY